ncbi:MAG: response regulator [Sulfurimonas sp.]|nr:response regulator [Sulfurimonas sp.]
MTIKLKIMSITILSLLLMVVVLGTISTKQVENILIKKNYDTLTSARDSKVQQIKSFFNEKVIDIEVLSKSLEVKQLIKAQSKQKNIDLYDEYYKNYINRHSLYNIFIIDKKNTQILYSSNKIIKSNDAIDTLIEKIIRFKKPIFTDVKVYGDAKTLSLFLGAPVYIDGIFTSIIIFHISTHEINYIMKFTKGYGDTQKDYLIGKDSLMISNSYFNGEYKSKQITINKYMEHSNYSKSILYKKSGIILLKDDEDNFILSAYAPLKIEENLEWTMISVIEKNEVMISLNNIVNNIIIISFILLIIISSIVIVIINKNIINPLNNFQDGLLNFFKYLNKENVEVTKLYVESNDEIGQMARAVNKNIVNTKSFILMERELSKHDQELNESLKKVIKDNEKHTWIKNGLAILHDKLSGNLNVSDVGNISITHLGNYINAGVGVLYVINDKKELSICSDYSYIKSDGALTNFKLGEGTIGQVALQKSSMLLKGVEQSRLTIQTGVVNNKPLNIYIFPLIFKDEVFGVIEIGTSKLFDETSQEFLKSSNIIIATALATSFNNQKVTNLLKNIKSSNSKMQIQQQELEESNAYMEEQQHKLEETNFKIEEQKLQLEKQNEKLIKSQNMLDKKANDLALSNKYKSEFLANMSHELRTPLNSIILLSDMLQENQKSHLDKNEVKKAMVINSSGNDLLKLIGNVLDLSKIEAGMMDLNIDKFSSSSLCEKFQIQFEDIVKQKSLKFKTVDKYKGYIINDQDKLSQIIRNLIANALKFTKKGSITMLIDSTIDNKIEISIIDTGIGIATDKVKSIFDAFKQADGTTSREYGGTGLGLSISLELVKMMGGEISLDSKENKGSRFNIIIPNINDISKGNNNKTKVISENRDDRYNIKVNDKVFLIIEDDEVFSNILRDKINLQDEYALIASSGKDGLNLAKLYNIKGILLDLSLPDMEGIDLLKELKIDVNLQKIPVYVISGDQKTEVSKEFGAKGFFKKPITDIEITHIINEIKVISDEVDTFVNRVNKYDSDSKVTLNLENKKILVVDDDIRNVYVLLEALSSRGADVITASNGKEAIDVLVNNKDINIVLMDIMMPVMDGYKAVKNIKNNIEIKHIPVIAVTAKAMSGDKEKALQKGFDDYITKPLQMSKLSTIIENWI